MLTAYSAPGCSLCSRYRLEVKVKLESLQATSHHKFQPTFSFRYFNVCLFFHLPLKNCLRPNSFTFGKLKIQWNSNWKNIFPIGILIFFNWYFIFPIGKIFFQWVFHLPNWMNISPPSIVTSVRK